MIEMIKKTVKKYLEQHFRTFPTQISGHTIHFYWKMLQMLKTCNKTMCKVRTNAKFIKPTCPTCKNPSIWPLIGSLTCTQPILGLWPSNQPIWQSCQNCKKKLQCCHDNSDNFWATFSLEGIRPSNLLQGPHRHIKWHIWTPKTYSTL